MIKRRLVYALALAGGLIFYCSYQEWLSWFLPVLMLALPWFSLLASLPAIFSCRPRILCPDKVSQGNQVTLRWEGQSTIPLPRLTGILMAENRLTGQRYRLRSGQQLPTEHCGALAVRLHRPRCQDYLGLFRLPIRRMDEAAVLVRPLPQAPEKVPDLSRFQACIWQPKPGGGFSENHELRLYRPGDNLRQVHWKLSAKTGKLITREAMEPVRNSMVLTLSLRGTAQQLDQKLGRLLWMSDHLLSKELPHQIACQRAQGLVLFDIQCPEDLSRAIDALLLSTPATAETEDFPTAFWRYHIGGDAHE